MLLTFAVQWSSSRCSKRTGIVSEPTEASTLKGSARRSSKSQRVSSNFFASSRAFSDSSRGAVFPSFLRHNLERPCSPAQPVVGAASLASLAGCGITSAGCVSMRRFGGKGRAQRGSCVRCMRATAFCRRRAPKTLAACNTLASAAVRRVTLDGAGFRAQATDWRCA